MTENEGYNTYDLEEVTRTFKYKDKDEICGGCTIESDNPHIAVLETYKDFREALDELYKYAPDCVVWSSPIGTMLTITEYMVESYNADEDGFFVSGSDFDYSREFYYDDDLDDIVITN